jgi:hypothetical protein
MKRKGKKMGRDPSPHPFHGKGREQKFREAKGGGMEGMKIERLGMKGNEFLELASNIYKII